jgi:hypothetical protein
MLWHATAEPQRHMPLCGKASTPILGLPAYPTSEDANRARWR